MNTKKLADLLKAVQQSRHKSASQLAREIGIPQQTLSAYSNNTGTIPRIDNLEKIAAYLEVSLLELLQELGYETNSSKQIDLPICAEQAYRPLQSMPNQEKIKLASLLLNAVVV